ncbi:hypothetical protein ACJMK2_024809, partial [Sinanodonta woodiana]
EMKSGILMILLTCMLFQTYYSCSICNQNKPCHCACEDEAASCRAYCRTITGSVVLNVNKINQCYDNCFAAFQNCLNRC